MGKPIDYLAYPGGFNNAEIQRITSESGYKMAFTVTPGTVKPGQNLYALPRLALFQGDYHSGCVCTARHLLLIHGNYEIHYGIMDLQNWLV